MEKIRKVETKLIIYKGFFMLPDGRNSKTFGSDTLKGLRSEIKRQVIKALKFTKFNYAECFISNKYDYLHDHYLLDPIGKRIKLNQKNGFNEERTKNRNWI